MTDELDRRLQSQLVDQLIEVGEVIGKPVASRVPRRQPEAAPVRCDDPPSVTQLVGDELETGAGVAPAVQKQQRLGVVAAPFADVIVNAPHGERFHAGPSSRLITHRRGCSYPGVTIKSCQCADKSYATQTFMLTLSPALVYNYGVKLKPATITEHTTE